MAHLAFEIIPALAVLAATSGFAQELEFARVETLDTIGTWRSGYHYGDIRLLSVQSGYENVVSTSFVDWTFIDPNSGKESIVATLGLRACDGSPIQAEMIKAQPQVAIDAPVLLEIQSGVAIKVSTPGIVRLSGC